jgi:hypothetical protein
MRGVLEFSSINSVPLTEQVFAPCANSIEQESAEEAEKRMVRQIFELPTGEVTLLPLLPPVKWILVAAMPRWDFCGVFFSV